MGKIIEIDKQDVNVSYTGTWSGFAGGNEVELTTINDVYGYGEIGFPICDDGGASAANLIEGVDYNYDSLLDTSTGGSNVDIYDDADSGSLATNKYFRIVENDDNVSDGLGLSIRAKNLTTIISPPADEVYVDPYTGKFVLPRPSYWSKCESLASITTPEIGTSTITGNPHEYQVSGKFGNQAQMHGTYLPQPPSLTTSLAYSRIDPNVSCAAKGTASFYARVNGYSNVDDSPYAGGSTFWGGTRTEGIDAFYDGDPGSCSGWGVGACCYITGGTTKNRKIVLLFDSVIKASFDITTAVIYHIYVVWDVAKSLSGGKSIRVFIDGVERLSTTDTFVETDLEFTICAGRLWSSFTPTIHYYGLCDLDNPKVWDHIVSEDPTWLYNGGTGRETALHEIYGSGNGYISDLSSAGSGAGFYHITQSNAPALLDEGDASGANATWELR